MSALDEIRGRWESATPGPWKVEPYLYAAEDGRVRVTSPSDGPDYNTAESVLEKDATAIAHAPEDVRLLLAALEAVEKLHAGWEHDAPDPLILLLVERTREAIKSALGDPA